MFLSADATVVRKAKGKEKASQRRDAVNEERQLPPFLPLSVAAIVAQVETTLTVNAANFRLRTVLSLRWLRTLRSIVDVAADEEFLALLASQMRYDHVSSPMLFIETYLRFRVPESTDITDVAHKHTDRALDKLVYVLLHRLALIASRVAQEDNTYPQSLESDTLPSVLQQLPALTLLDIAKWYSHNKRLSEKTSMLLQSLLQTRPEYVSEIHDAIHVTSATINNINAELQQIQLDVQVDLSYINNEQTITQDSLDAVVRKLEVLSLKHILTFIYDAARTFAKFYELCPHVAQQTFTGNDITIGMQFVHALAALYSNSLTNLSIILHTCIVTLNACSTTKTVAMTLPQLQRFIHTTHNDIKQAKASLIILLNRIFQVAYYQPICQVNVNGDSLKLFTTGLSAFFQQLTDAQQRTSTALISDKSHIKLIDAPVLIDWAGSTQLIQQLTEILEEPQKVSLVNVIPYTIDELQQAVDDLESEYFAPNIEASATSEAESYRRTTLISTVSELFPDLGDGFIDACLRYYADDPEKVIAVLLEPNQLDPKLDALDRTLPRLAIPCLENLSLLNEKVNLELQNQNVLSSRRNIFDGDAFDVFSGAQLDMSKVHRGKQRNGDAQILLDDKTFVNENKEKLMIDVFYDEYDDEYDDTYDTAGAVQSIRAIDLNDVEDLSDMQEHARNESRTNILKDNEAPVSRQQELDLLLFAAYRSDPTAFDRSIVSRRSSARAQLCKSTNLTNEQIEGWRIMLERTPRKSKFLSDMLLLEGGRSSSKAAINSTKWQKSSSEDNGEGDQSQENTSSTIPQSQGRGRGGESRGRNRGGRGRGRGVNRKQGHEKKMVRMGAL